MWPLRNSTFVAPACGGVRLRERQHLVGHVDAEGPTGRADPLGRQQDVDAAARAEVEDALAGVEVGDGGRVAAAERGEDGRVGQLVALEGGVEVRADGLGIAATRGALRGADRRGGVVLADGLVDGLGGHRCGLLVLRAGRDAVLILDDIDICQYMWPREAPDRPRRPAPPGRGRPDPTGDPAPAERLRRGLRLRLHGVLRRQPADRVASPQGPPRRRLDRGRAARHVDLVLAPTPGGRPVPRARRRPSARRCRWRPPRPRRLPVIEARSLAPWRTRLAVDPSALRLHAQLGTQPDRRGAAGARRRHAFASSRPAPRRPVSTRSPSGS